MSAVLALVLPACGAPVPGLTVMEESVSATLPGYRFFVMSDDQPADQHNPAARAE